MHTFARQYRSGFIVGKALLCIGAVRRTLFAIGKSIGGIAVAVLCTSSSGWAAVGCVGCAAGRAEPILCLVSRDVVD